MMLTSRGYVKHGRNRIKFIVASVGIDPYSPGLNEYIYIISNEEDERKFVFSGGSQYGHNWYASLPVGVWCQTWNAAEEEKARKEREVVKYG